jgi:putative flavoprotein involved in K+ transport
MSLPSRTDTVIVGAGHNGLAMSRLLTLGGMDHVVIERRETLGGGWQDRWDDFQLVSPNWALALPGQPYEGSDPDGFMPRDEVVATMRRYAETVAAPVVAGTEVTRVAGSSFGGAGDRFVVETAAGPVNARNVVVTIGAYHRPHIPPIGAALPSRVVQVHSHLYRRESDLPPGGIVVVGSGQTGVQLAEELQDAGREVYLSAGTAPRIPRRYRGRDIFHWLVDLAIRGPAVGVTLPSVDKLPSPRARFAGNAALSGHKGGHSTDLRAMGASGITLLGRIDAVDGELVRFTPGLPQTLDRVAGFFGQNVEPLFDDYVAAAGESFPPDDNVWSDFEPPELAELDLGRAGISSVLWASGFRPDYRWIGFAILDDMGLPRTQRGVSEVPGLYFVGGLWQTNQASATLFGPRIDAPHVAAAMGLTLPDSEQGRDDPREGRPA